MLTRDLFAVADPLVCFIRGLHGTS